MAQRTQHTARTHTAHTQHAHTAHCHQVTYLGKKETPLTVDFYDTLAFGRVNMRKISERLTKQTDRLTDRQTDRQTD